VVKISEDKLAAFLKTTVKGGTAVGHLSMAKALVEAEIGASIDERDSVIKEVLLYNVDPDQRFLLPDGPIDVITSATLDGVTQDILTDLDVHWWSVKHPDGFSKGKWQFTATLGFDTEASVDTLPDKIREAIIGTASELWGRPRSFTSERIGDYSYTINGTAEAGLGARSLSLLREFRRPTI
jgi:hypothetical protein